MRSNGRLQLRRSERSVGGLQLVKLGQVVGGLQVMKSEEPTDGELHEVKLSGA